MWDLRMDLNFAKVLSELELLLRTEILVTEEDYTSLGDEKGEFISLLICEVLELETDDFGADVSSEVLDFLCSGEKRGLVLVCPSAGVDVFSVFIPDGVDILEV